MAIQLIGAASTAKWSITSAELGFNLSSFSLTVSPEVDVPLLRIDGQVNGGAIGDPMGDLKMSGEALDLTTASNVTLVNAYTAFVPVNTANYFLRSQGGFYLKSGEIKFDRGGWATIDTNHKSHYNLA
jgi:hypothetical protein